MIVFGDPQQRTTTRRAVARLLQHATTVHHLFLADRAPTPMAMVDAIRRLLMHAGCLEQAVHDAADSDVIDAAWIAVVEASTDAAAQLFVAMIDRGAVDSDVATLCSAAVEAVEQLTRLPPAPLTIKTPEGFAFYGLFPEQYVRAARMWCAARGEGADELGVVVIGLRSIGTTLSAVVRATLVGAGRRAHRITVRPTGPTWDRSIDIDPDRLAGAGAAVVVDEGPGLSGSTMASVAEALIATNMAPAAISFMPGHSGQPGSMAPPTVRRRWEVTPCFVAAPERLRWSGRSIPEHLATLTPGMARSTAGIERIDDVSAGSWRRFVYDRPEQWPAVDTPFERTKFRCVLDDGSAVLWKFVGLDDEITFEQLLERSARSRAPAPLGLALGFIAVPWLDLPALRADDVDVSTIGAVARHVCDAAGPTLSRDELRAASDRLAEMMIWNTGEHFGSDLADRARQRWGDPLARTGRTARARAGDGRMGPQAWRRGRNGRLWKLGGVGYDRDHTMIGRQPLSWDVAGAIVEWQLEGAERTLFLDHLADADIVLAPQVLAFHEASYAAFRLGQTVMSNQIGGHDASDAERLAAASRRYADRLCTVFDQDP